MGKASYAAFRRNAVHDQTWDGKAWVDYDGEAPLTLIPGTVAVDLMPDETDVNGKVRGYRYWLIDTQDDGARPERHSRE